MVVVDLALLLDQEQLDKVLPVAFLTLQDLLIQAVVVEEQVRLAAMVILALAVMAVMDCNTALVDLRLITLVVAAETCKKDLHKDLEVLVVVAPEQTVDMEYQEHQTLEVVEVAPDTMVPVEAMEDLVS